MPRTVRIENAQRCPLCREQVAPAHARRLIACSACETVYHRSCFGEMGGCAVLGCLRFSEPQRSARPALKGELPKPTQGAEKPLPARPLWPWALLALLLLALLAWPAPHSDHPIPLAPHKPELPPPAEPERPPPAEPERAPPAKPERPPPAKPERPPPPVPADWNGLISFSLGLYDDEPAERHIDELGILRTSLEYESRIRDDAKEVDPLLEQVRLLKDMSPTCATHVARIAELDRAHSRVTLERALDEGLRVRVVAAGALAMLGEGDPERLRLILEEAVRSSRSGTVKKRAQVGLAALEGEERRCATCRTYRGLADEQGRVMRER